jgi:hypothetical protein
MLPVSLDSFCFFVSYCAPYVASFSGLSLVFSFVLCTLCCQFLKTIQRNWQHRVHNTTEKTTTQSRETGNIGYTIRRKKPKDCFLFFSVVLCPLFCHFLWIVFVFFLRIVHPMLPVSLDCLCFFASYCAPYVASFSGLSLVFSFVLCTHTIRRKKPQHNPEKLAT